MTIRRKADNRWCLDDLQALQATASASSFSIFKLPMMKSWRSGVFLPLANL